MRDSGHDVQQIFRNKGKGPLSLHNIDTPTNNELSSGSSPFLNLSLAKNTQENIRTRLRKRPLPHLAFNDTVSGASRKARKEAGRRKYRSDQALGNPLAFPLSTLPPTLPAHPAFGTTPTYYLPSTTLI